MAGCSKTRAHMMPPPRLQAEGTVECSHAVHVHQGPLRRLRHKPQCPLRKIAVRGLHLLQDRHQSPAIRVVPACDSQDFTFIHRRLRVLPAILHHGPPIHLNGIPHSAKPLLQRPERHTTPGSHNPRKARLSGSNPFPKCCSHPRYAPKTTVRRTRTSRRKE